MSQPGTQSKAFEIKMVTKDDVAAVINHIRNNFHVDEPLNHFLQLVEERGTSCPELEEYATKDIKNNLSIMAVTPLGEVIGVALNAILKRGDNTKEDEDIPHPKIAKIYRLLNKMDAEANIFGKYPNVDKVLTIKVLSVEKACRGAGVGRELINRSRNIASTSGCGLIRVDCSSHFTAMAAKRLGFDCIYSLKYEDFKESGKPVFTPEDPHKEATIYVKEC